MVNCGIPELQSKSDLKYVYDTLKPTATDTEATTMFTRYVFNCIPKYYYGSQGDCRTTELSKLWVLYFFEIRF